MHGMVICVTCTADGKTLIYGSDTHDIYFISIATGKQLAVLGGHSEFVSCLALSPDGKILASGSLDNTICLWNVATATKIATLTDCHDIWVDGLAFSPDGNTLASVGGHTLRLWDVPTRKAKATFQSKDEFLGGPLRYSPDGKNIATTGDIVKLWDSATGSVLASYGEREASSVHCVAFDPGSMIASADFSGDAFLWDMNSRNQPVTLKGNEEPVYSLAFSPDGSYLAAGYYDRTIKGCGAAASHQELATLRGHHKESGVFPSILPEWRIADFREL